MGQVGQSNIKYPKVYQPKNGFGCMVVQIRTPSVNLPFQAIKGVVHLQVYLNMPASHIETTLVGVQRLSWLEWGYLKVHPQQPIVMKTQQNYRDQREIINTTHTVYMFQNGMIPAGNYSIEFSMKLPPHYKYPASCLIYNQDKLQSAQIDYKLFVTLHGSQPLGFMGIIEVKEDIGPFVPGMQITDKAPIDCCLFYNRGKIELSAFADKMSYYANEKCKLTIRVDTTEMKTKVKKITCALKGQVFVAFEGRMKRRFVFDIHQVEIDGLDKGNYESKTVDIDLKNAFRNKETSIPSNIIGDMRNLALGIQNSSGLGEKVKFDYFIDIKACLGQDRYYGNEGPVCRVHLRILKPVDEPH